MCCTIVLLHSLIYDEDGGIAGADSCMSEVHIASSVGFHVFQEAEMGKAKVSYSSSSPLQSLLQPTKIQS